MKTKRLSTLLALVVCFMLMLSACSQPTTTTEADPTAAPTTAASTTEPPSTEALTEAPETVPSETEYDPYHVERELAAANAALQLEYAPQVKTLASGVQVQRTPYDGSGFNTYVLNADARGCASCHDDLAELAHNMPQDHMDIQLVGDTELTVNHCISCHEYTHGYVYEDYGMASYLHGYHSGPEFTAVGGTCMSCHEVNMETGEMELWDNAKFYRLRGIIDVDAESSEAEFTYDQTTTTDPDDIFCLNWVAGFSDYMFYDGYENGLQPVPEDFDNWTITVDGMVDNEFTITLPEMIDKYESVTQIMTLHCTYDPAPGGLTATCEVTGIRIQDLLADAGVQEGAIEVYNAPPDEACVYPVLLDYLKDHDALLVYEINGRRLTMAEGYPLWAWVGGMGAPCCVRQITKLTVAADPIEDLYLYQGWEHVDRETGYMNVPCCAFIELYDGQIFPAYEPVTLEGFADAYSDPIVAVEISMDRGATWTTYEIGDTDTDVWVHWTYTFTPEEGSYVIMARAITESGKVSETPDVLLINAQ